MSATSSTNFLNSRTPLLNLKLYVVISILLTCSIVFIFLLVCLCVRLNRNSRKRKMQVEHSSGSIPLVSKEIVEIKNMDQDDKVASQVDLRKKMMEEDKEEEEKDQVSSASDVSGQNNIGWGRWYSLKELEMATRGFVEESVVGEGGYGVVYRGVLHDGSVVAVKNLLNNKGQAEKEFKVEVEAIGKVRHKNLVGLLGYCAEGAQRMLVYEYVGNGNLEQWLHGDVGPVSPLTWDIRMKIAIGTAKGLAYLHEGLEPKVVHRDVKSSNILLDEKWNPKVSDFGLAKLLGSEASYVTTRVMGTFGYVSPEYASTGMLNEGNDVYSFGVLLMEIITGRSPVDYSKPPGEMNLVDWFKGMLASRRGDDVLDPLMEVQPTPRALKRALLICLRCIDLDANKRPKMGQIVHMLEADDFPFRSVSTVCALVSFTLQFLCRNHTGDGGVGESDMEEKLIARLESAVARLEALSTARSPAGSTGDAAADPSIAAFDDMMAQYFGRVSTAAENIGGKVLDVTKIVGEAFNVQKDLLIKAMQSQKPDMAGLAEFLNPLNEVIMKANALTEGRRSDFFNHSKTAADSLTALAWIAYTGKDCGMSMPIAHVEESWQMAEFYNNKVMVEYKSKDPNHVEWAKAMKELYLPGLRDYVKSHYPLGPLWSATGKAPSSAPTKAPTASTPAPPPPPPASLFSSESSQPSQSHPKEGMAAVFQEISSGKPVTSCLRKVTDDMKTKNRADRSGVVGTIEKESRASGPSFSRAAPPKLELQMGRKWVVENQIGSKSLVIDDCDARQSVYIFGCKDSVLQIQGKVNNITIDKCSKMGIVFKDVVAACEIVNCNGVEVQCQGSAPTISVDNTAGCQLYLSKESLGASITTAKSSEINVLVPGGEADSDWGEHALPQQFVHVFKDGHFETTPVSHSGG
ncbi:Pkinase domain-containing protein/CAP_N domain-containing protein/CAP_C domain-containing protein [Cephalotus follicularis]|uniref:non-specific serine/threonine protein kinase n=1 Tax=Cephalotus follicularis TaxID=3775 RepID=A0A1Q3BPT7_CEPFO|nr:Pkinase domain-containing protein/CAP_N domain-containing protein/CAP_C domain-containing protein [Cephalotus follicularis]